ncbi:AAA family ATPase [Streptomyces sp. MK7]|uniref:AAA family ATPase n=1 Tax=Streptomyces sp. MK7 TaxID=3067635 RepID=UPI002930D817|nr:AAA family ATPase [Streptomyces sp. MK7]
MTTFPLHGRDSELAILREAHTAVRSGGGMCLLVEGAPGVGRTRLLQEAVRIGRTEGFDVVRVEADELDQYASRSTLLAALREAGEGDGEEPGQGVAEQPFWVLDRIAEILERRVRRAPVSVVVDDAQWADPTTLSALRALPKRLVDSRILWILGMQTASGRALARHARDYLEENGATRLVLRPLDTEAITRIAADLLGRAPESGLAPLLRDVHGNPFLVVELLRALERSGGQAPIAGGPPVPAGFRRTVHRRLGELPEDAMRLLQIGSVLGRRFDLVTAARMLDRRVGTLLPAVSAALGAELLAEDGDRLAFRHELVRRAVYEELPRPMRSALHREAGELLGTAGAPSAEVIRHVVLGGGPLDQEAMRTLLRAVRDIAATVPEAAADLALEAADRLSLSDPRRIELLTEAAYQLTGTRRIQEALHLVNSTLSDDLAAAQQAALHLVAAEIHQAAGDDTTAMAHTRLALALPDLREDVRTQLLKTQGTGLVSMGELASAEAIGGMLIEGARRSRDTAVVVSAMVFQSQIAFYRGRLSDAVELAEEARQRSDAEPHTIRLRPPRVPALWLATVLTATDRLDDAERTLREGQRQAEALGLGWSLPHWHVHRAWVLLERGALDDAAVEAEACLAVADELEITRAVPLARAVLADVAVRRGDLSQARTQLRTAEATAGIGNPPHGPWLALARAALLDAENHSREAADLTRGFGTGPAWLPSLPPSHWPRLVRIALRGGGREAAEAIRAVLRRIAGEGGGHVVTRAVDAHVQGLVEGSPEPLRAAVRDYRRGPRVLALAAAHEDLGNVLISEGAVDEAVPQLREAQVLLRRYGAARDHDRVRRRLGDLGVRAAPGPHRPAATSGWDSLSESELRVAPLVAEGLTNRAIAERLYLSVHTVNTHLRHIFTKLGINTRVELTRLFLEREAAGPPES